MANAVIKWQKTIGGKLISVVACLGLTYLFFSLSVDRGNPFYYLLTLIFLVYFLKFTVRLIGGAFHGFQRQK